MYPAVRFLGGCMTININNTTSLLEECYVNGNQGSQSLHAWFLDNVNLIFQTIQELENQNLTDRSSRVAKACALWKSYYNVKITCIRPCLRYRPPPA